MCILAVAIAVAFAVAALAGSTSAHATTAEQPKARGLVNRAPSVVLVAALEPASVRGMPAENFSDVMGGAVNRSESRTRIDPGVASAFERWSFWVGGLGLILFVVRRRLSD